MPRWGASLLALAICAACVPPAGSNSGSPTGSAADAVASEAGCEYLGARFVPPVGWSVEEQREKDDPLPRITLRGRIGTHGILADIIARPLIAQGGPTPAQQTRVYFDALRSAPFAKTWTAAQETSYPGPTRTYPALIYRELVNGPFGAPDRVIDTYVLLYFPEDFPRGGYFYSFIWSDNHGSSEEPAPVTELENLVNGYTVRGSPASSPKGCSR